MSNSELVTYLNKPELKAAFMAEIAKHEAADALIKGSYGQMNGHFRGCAIGCSLHSLNLLQGKTGQEALERTGDHERYEAELGLPRWLAYLEDHLFDSLPDALSRTWPRRFADAIPVGAVVSDRVLADILCWVITDPTYGVHQATDRDDVRAWVNAIAEWVAADARGTASEALRADAERAAGDAEAAWAAWDAWAARAARDARDARAARAARAAEIRDGFHPALSEHALTLLRGLSTEQRCVEPPA